LAYPVARPPRRRSGRWQPLLGVLLILAVLLVVADRAAEAEASSQMRSLVGTQLAKHDVSYATLDVTIGGTPFLTQVVQRRFTSLAIDMTQVHISANGKQATLPSLHVLASGVHFDPVTVLRGEPAAVTTEAVSGNAIVTYATLSSLLDLSQYHLTDLQFEERDGGLRATGNVSVGGVTVPMQATADVSVTAGRIELRLRDAGAVGAALPAVAVSALDALVHAVLNPALPPLPFGIALQSLQVTPDGLAVAITGHDLTLAERTR
jgi:hypothetical protein